MLGGDGDDLIIGKSGRDFLLGGPGADRIVGNLDGDILIAGVLLNLVDLDEVMDEWTSSNDYYDRVDYLSNCEDCLILGGSEATVLDDEAVDQLTGSTGQDWFFANLEEGVIDKITDLQDDEFAEDID